MFWLCRKVFLRFAENSEIPVFLSQVLITVIHLLNCTYFINWDKIHSFLRGSIAGYMAVRDMYAGFEDQSASGNVTFYC